MKKIFEKIGSTFACLALLVTTMSANHGCLIIMYQPELPEGADKLRKF